MNKALALAEKGRGTTRPNPMVGAVIVKNDKIIAQGYHRMAGGPHAEINAINSIKSIPEGSIMYVTLEPCSFYGKTPPCTEAIIKNSISEVTAACVDPNPKVSGRGLEILKNAGVKVRVGLLKEKAEKQNEVFFKSIKRKTPFVCLKTASSLDGKTALKNGLSKWLTGPDSRQTVSSLRFEYGCVMTGINTVLRDDPFLYPHKRGAEDLLDVKNSIIYKKVKTTALKENTHEAPYRFFQFKRVILDSFLRIDENCNIVNTSENIKTIIFTSRNTLESQKEKIFKLKEKGIELIGVPFKDGNEGKLDLSEILKILYNYFDITSVLLESGPSLTASFLIDGLIDKFLIFYSPKIIGSDSGFGIFGDLSILRMDKIKNLRFEKITGSGSDILLEAYPVY